MSETTESSKSGATTAAILYLHAQTAMHPGSGTALGTVDLPVQRERHTQWPVVPGSALKGILRDRCREQARTRFENSRKRANEEDPQLVSAFGPARVDGDNAHAGALSISDARLLAFPVRSLKGVFAWVTCPAVLERYVRDLALAGVRLDWKIPYVGSEKALVIKTSPLIVDENQLVLEEFQFESIGDLANARSWIAAQVCCDEYTKRRLEPNLVVLCDDDYTHFVKHATEVTARVALDYETKTVKTGALFYQEFLPAESLFYSVVFAAASRRKDDPATAGDTMRYLAANIPDGTVLQVGGDETTGKGICLARLAIK
ncbi:MAG: type III-B CRISPR module RAMP protein Cmr4 [Planctomycetota bacterium]|nr:type III-B CRISPR module RAMP protein Cmr4 [Planctomycetota bacterium]